MTQAVLEQSSAIADSTSTERYVYFFGGGKAEATAR